jgi:sugar O-acyltransferase (sialic acid O-acetyltransferase NeuD family)
MSTESICIVGAGGQGKIVLDTLLACGIERSRIRMTDRNSLLIGTYVLEVPIETPDIPLDLKAASFHVAIGENRTRERLSEQLVKMGGVPYSAIHPTATISAFSTIDEGVFIAAHAIVAPSSLVNEGCIINHGAVIDHDCLVGRFSQISPNVTLGGGVRIGARVLIGAGANVLPGISIGDDAIIGAGSVVTRDVNAGETRKGIPAV